MATAADRATPPAQRQRMKRAMDLLHGVRVELAGHRNLSIPSALRHQYPNFI
jgi:hypothetical protein